MVGFRSIAGTRSWPSLPGLSLSGRPGLRGTQTFTDWVTGQRARGTL